MADIFRGLCNLSGFGSLSLVMEPPDEEYWLATQARNGDPNALTSLVERIRVRLFAQAYSVLHHYDDAQDAVAEALLQVCLHIGDLRQPERIVPWMQSIVRREARRLRQAPDALPLRVEESDPHAEHVGALVLRLDIEQALRHLPGQQAQALRLFHLNGLSVREIGEAMGTPGRAVAETTVKVWLHRGRRHLAAEMKGYAPMTEQSAMMKPTTTEPTKTEAAPTTAPASPLRPAAILHTDLTPELLRAVSEALHSGGFEPQVLAPSDLPDFRADQLPLRLALQCYEALVVDETVGGRSGLEYVLFCKAHAETANIPITLLHSQEENALLVTACYAAGVAHLARRNAPGTLAAALRAPEEPKKGSWESFTERARRIVMQAQKEAIRLDDNCVSTEHLLLGLIHEADCAGARILVERLGVPLDRIAEEVNSLVSHGTGRDATLDLILTPRSRNAIDFAQKEAVHLGQGYIGSEHILLGLIREEDGLAGRILAGFGVSLEQGREVVARWQTEARP